MTNSKSIFSFSSVYIWLGIGLLILTAIISLWMREQVSAASADGAIPGQYIVVLRDEVANPAAVAVEMAGAQGLGIGHVYRYALKGFSGTVPAGRLLALQHDPRVAFVSEDREVNVEKSPFQSPVPSTEVQPSPQVLPTGVDRVNAEANATPASSVNVAVIDTGIDLTHPDLAANIVGGKNCSTGRSYADGNGHGTHVAGIIGALDNGIGVRGVDPNVKLWSVRVLNNSGSGTWASVICGIDFVTSKAPGNGGPITVANMSLGGGGSDDQNCGNTNSDALHKAICNSVAKGVTYVVAAGNESSDVKNSAPAAYDEVITVSALADSDGKACGTGAATGYGADDTFASFSNYASLASDFGHMIAAPGVSIYSTYKGSAYATLSGTSMASPHVAGAAARYIAANPGFAPAAIYAALSALAEPANVNFNGECLGGASHTDGGLHPEGVVRADTL